MNNSILISKLTQNLKYKVILFENMGFNQKKIDEILKKDVELLNEIQISAFEY